MLARGFASLDNAGSRQAFLHTVRAVIEPGGQRVSASDRLALAARLPTLIVWGERDSIIPAAHGARRARGDARQPLRGLRRSPATCPTTTTPTASPRCSTDFCATTDGARLEHDHWQPLLGDTP